MIPFSNVIDESVRFRGYKSTNWGYTIEGAEGLIILRAQNMQNEPKSQNKKNQTKIVRKKEELRKNS